MNIHRRIFWGSVMLGAILLSSGLWTSFNLWQNISHENASKDGPIPTSSPPGLAGSRSYPANPTSTANRSNAPPNTDQRQPHQEKTNPASSAPPAPESQNTISVSLIVGPDTYTAQVPPGATIYELMNILATKSSFTFKATYFLGLGHLIDEINAMRSSSGTYWTLYVNGKYATVGVSQYKISEGDRIEWKYEHR